MNVHVQSTVLGLRSPATSEVIRGTEIAICALELATKSNARALVISQRSGDHDAQVSASLCLHKRVISVEARYRVVHVLKRFRVRVLRHLCLLTVKLRGRTEAPDMRRGRILFSGARGAKPQARHGPLERVLEGLPLPPNKAT